MNCHEAVDRMGDALEGRLGEIPRAMFEEHMSECAPCATYLEHLVATRQVLRNLPREACPEAVRAELIARFHAEFGDG